MLMLTLLVFNSVVHAHSLILEGPQSETLDLEQLHQLLIEERLARINSENELKDRIFELESERSYCGLYLLIDELRPSQSGA